MQESQPLSENKEIELLPVPDVLSSGISKEYMKAFGPLNRHLRSCYEGATIRIKKFGKDSLLQYNFRTYERWFSSNEFKDVINNINKNKIEQLNKIVKELNEMVEDGTIIEDPTPEKPHKPTELFNSAMGIIFNDPEFDYKKICEEKKVALYFARY